MAFDNTQAHSEGWGLFVVDHHYRLQRLDDPSSVGGLAFTEPMFESDAAAIVHVAQSAGSSLYHRTAIDLIGRQAQVYSIADRHPVQTVRLVPEDALAYLDKVDEGPEGWFLVQKSSSSYGNMFFLDVGGANDPLEIYLRPDGTWTATTQVPVYSVEK